MATDESLPYPIQRYSGTIVSQAHGIRLVKLVAFLRYQRAQTHEPHQTVLLHVHSATFMCSYLLHFITISFLSFFPILLLYCTFLVFFDTRILVAKQRKRQSVGAL